jgi:hypothetical protein
VRRRELCAELCLLTFNEQFNESLSEEGVRLSARVRHPVNGRP